MVFNLSQQDDWKLDFATSIWQTWCNRNKIVFQQSMTHPRLCYHRVVADFPSNKSVFQVPVGSGFKIKSLVCWVPPKGEFIKLNTNVAWRIDPAFAGIGGVFHNCKGLWEFGFSKKIDASSPATSRASGYYIGSSYCLGV